MTEHCTAKRLAELLDLSERRIGQLVAEGVIPRAGRGKYPLPDAVRAYVTYLRDNVSEVSDLNQERARLAKEQADKLARERLRDEGRTLDADEAEQGWHAACVAIKSALMAVPRKAAPLVVACASVAEVEAVLDDQVRDGLHRAIEGATRAVRN